MGSLRRKQRLLSRTLNHSVLEIRTSRDRQQVLNMAFTWRMRPPHHWSRSFRRCYGLSSPWQKPIAAIYCYLKAREVCSSGSGRNGKQCFMQIIESFYQRFQAGMSHVTVAYPAIGQWPKHIVRKLQKNFSCSRGLKSLPWSVFSRKRSLIVMQSWLGISKYFLSQSQADEVAAKHEKALQAGLSDHIEEVGYIGLK